MFRPMTDDDLDKIIILENKLFKDPWTKDNYLYDLHENEFSKLFVYEVDNEIVSYGGIWILFDKAEIVNIGVNPIYQGKGYGRKMMSFLIENALNEECESISLEVRVSNEKAINLYKSFDFEIVALRESYYDDFEDAYLMVKGI